MADTLSEALLVLTSWNTASDDLISQPTRTLVKDFCENTLKSDKVSKLYCTVLDVEVSEDQKKDAESVGVTLIPATRSKWSDPVGDQPTPTWLLHHYTYYPGLKELKHIKHIVSFSPKTKNAAAAIHESLFPQALFHQLSPPEPNGVLFTFDIWSKDACGLAGCHRSIIHDFCVRKGRTGELLKAFSTVLDVKLTEDQKIDAEKCRVTLIPAKEKIGTKKKDLPNVDWLLKHESHYPDLGKLPNIKYVVGYAPKTGWAAADIREKLFPNAKLVLINHACPEKNCLLENGDEENNAFEEGMLKMASASDVLFSIGTKIHEYFQNAYRANVGGRQLSDIPHEEILPKLGQVYFDSEPVIVKDMQAHGILTYGQLDSLEAVKRCTSIAAAVGNVANKCEEFAHKIPEWKICGVSTEDSKEAQTILNEKLQSNKVLPKFYTVYSAPTLLRSIQQSHLCLPPSCYTDYSFEGLEAMAAGLPTTVQGDSHIAAMIDRHFKGHGDYCIVTDTQDNLAVKITKDLIRNIEAFQQAKKLKEDLTESKAVTESLAKFASIFKGGEAATQDSDKQVMQPDILVTEDIQIAEEAQMLDTGDKECEIFMKAMQTKLSGTEDTGVTEAAAVHPGISVTEDVDTTGTAAVHPGISVTEDVVTTGTAAVHPGISVTEGVDTTGTAAVHPGISVTEGVVTTGTAEPTVVKPDMPITEDRETREKTAMHPGISVTADIEITETKAVHYGMSVKEDKKTREATAVHHGIVRHEKSKTSKDIKHSETVENKTTYNRMQIKTKHITQWKGQSMHGNDKTRTSKMTRIEESSKGQLKQSKHEKTERNEDGHTKTKQTKQQTQRMKRSSINPSKPSPLHSTKAKENTYSDNFTVHVRLNEESYQQQMRDLNRQVQTWSVRRKKEQLKAKWEKIKGELEKNECQAVASRTSLQKVDRNCSDSFGEGTVTMSSKIGSIAISLYLPTLYNLYRVKQTCLSGSFPDSFEPLLITDKMREEADKVGLQLKLKATYDQARFDELELFFINRDGGGLEPVKLYDDFIEGKDAEEILIANEDTDQKSHTSVIGRIVSGSQTEQGQSPKDIQSQLEMSRTTLESQLKEAEEEKATLEERCKELTQTLESTEKSLVSQRIGSSREREKLQSELKDNQKLVNELQKTVVELQHNLEQSSLKKPAEKAPTSLPQRPPQHHHEMSAGHMMQASAATGPPTSPVVYSKAQQVPYQTAQSHTQGTTKDEMRPQRIQLQDQPNIQHTQKPKKYRSSPQGHLTSPHHQGKNPIPQEIQTSATQVYAPTLMPQQPPQHHHEMSTGHMMQASAATGPPTSPVVYSQAQQMPYQTAQPHTQGTTKGQMRPQRIQDQSEIQHTQKPKKDRSSPQGHLTSPHHQGKNPIPQEIQTKATQISGDWSVTLVNGQHQGQGQKFKLPNGLAFHRDKLMVCDYGNNIVQILNKDYSCDKVIGSFDGQFAKPFRPRSVAISHFNHYFILDDENKQIVVCDENGKIIKIITLPENIKVVWDIALMDDFVLVTLSLTSLDITRRKDRDDRLVKYTLSGEYVTEVSGQTSVQTKFFWPFSVAVNSNNVIMVYDWGNECIKCFDSDLNFLHQFGQSQLQIPRTESVIEGYGHIAVDEDDNVYVCGFLRVKSTGDVIKEWIVKYGCDGKWIFDLFKGHVSLPLYIAVMGDKIGVVERFSDQIKVFSK